jgi:hypothetical protein
MEQEEPPPASLFQPLLNLPPETLGRALPAAVASGLAELSSATIEGLEQAWQGLEACGASPMQLAAFVESKIPTAFHVTAAVGQGLELQWLADQLLDLQERGGLCD